MNEFLKWTTKAALSWAKHTADAARWVAPGIEVTTPKLRLKWLLALDCLVSSVAASAADSSMDRIAAVTRIGGLVSLTPSATPAVRSQPDGPTIAAAPATTGGGIGSDRR